MEQSNPKKKENSIQYYWDQFSRNIGLINSKDQQLLRRSNIAIFGIGGLGGSLVEQLVRTGCENLLICDNDLFELSNLNRQICTRKDIGKYKVDVIESFLRSINPEIILSKFKEINEKNISNLLNNINIAVLTLDDPSTSILIARECYKRKIPVLESWAIPYLCAWWFTESNIDYESFYGLKTHKMSIQEIINSVDLASDIRKSFFHKLLQFPDIANRYNREKDSLSNLISGSIPPISLAPIVRINASYLAFEVVFSGVLKLKKMILAPNIIGYDYFNMKPLNFTFSNSYIKSSMEL